MRSTPADVAFYCEDLRGGGVQTVFVRLANALAARGLAIELWVGSRDGERERGLPPAIAVIEIPRSSRLRAALAVARSAGAARAPALRAVARNERDAALLHLPALAATLAERRPRVLLAATPYRNLEALLARVLASSPTRVFVSEHNDLRSGNALGTGRHRALLGSLQRAWYPAAQGIVAVSSGLAEDVARRAGLPRDRVTVIHNPAVAPDLAERAREEVAHPWLAPGAPPVVLAVGRLAGAKDLPTLIRAFAKLRAGRDVRLAVLGQARRPKGTARRIAELRALAAELGVADDVDFPGYVANPFAWMARAAVFAVTSRNEGFCNVIAEALACGCPVVSTDCPSGPAEILDHGKYGRLVAVGDDAAFAAALAATLDAPPDSAQLRARGAQFDVDSAVAGYERLFRGDGAQPPSGRAAR